MVMPALLCKASHQAMLQGLPIRQASLKANLSRSLTPYAGNPLKSCRWGRAAASAHISMTSSTSPSICRPFLRYHSSLQV